MVRVEISDLTEPLIESNVYGTCAHFSSMDQNEKGHITRMIKQPKTVANQKSNQKQLLIKKATRNGCFFLQAVVY